MVYTHVDTKVHAREDEVIPSDEDIMRQYAMATAVVVVQRLDEGTYPLQ